LLTRGTLHALCLDILRAHGERLGLRRGFGVADEEYQRLVLRRLGVARKRMGALLTQFGRRRLQEFHLTGGDQDLLDRYLATLRARNVVDFDDLIALTRDLFERHADVAAAVAARWDHLLVDEFQDLNPPQYEILKILAEPHHSLFGVGDDAQSLFSWTGADPDVLRRFREDFGIGEPIVLDQNRRSSRQILRRRAAWWSATRCCSRSASKRCGTHRSPSCAASRTNRRAVWLIEDVLRDRAAHGLGWGDVAVLYRHHRLGEELEKFFLRAGIPCRLARGRALVDDDVIGQVIASLRVIRDPDDALALEALAQRLLPAELLERIRAVGAAAGRDLLAVVRRIARDSHASDPDTKKAWRFVFHVENLRALRQSHETLRGLVAELLTQRMGAYKNPLEEHADELTDPAAYPGAAALADRLAAGAAVWIVPHHGLEIALRGMLVRSGLVRVVTYLGPDDRPAAGDPALEADPQAPAEIVVRLFKALQLLHAGDLDAALERYVTFDLETTDNDVATCGIVEIGAARVVEGEIVDRFHSLVRPQQQSVAAAATQVHGYTDADLTAQPPFADVWPRFRAFVGDRVLVAHNGQQFDVPVLRRLAAGLDGGDELTCFDTLPLARALFPESARLEHLADRFGVDKGRPHHAEDDALTLARVLRHLVAHKLVRARKAALVNLLDQVGLGLALADDPAPTDERRLLRQLARTYALGRYSDCLEFYDAERSRTPAADAPGQEAVIERLGGRALRERLRADRTAAERYPSAVARLEALVAASAPDAGDGLDAGIQRLLERVALSSSEGVAADPDRVNLLTLHSTKGLEFSRVYIVGVEDYELPGYWATKEARRQEIEEGRRLLYVGMTRAGIG
jgi:DNA polymerase III epsilon subunit family exonuclease